MAIPAIMVVPSSPFDLDGASPVEHSVGPSLERPPFRSLQGRCHRTIRAPGAALSPDQRGERLRT